MSTAGPPEPNADFKRAMRRFWIAIAVSLTSTLALVWYLWENSPKPP